MSWYMVRRAGSSGPQSRGIADVREMTGEPRGNKWALKGPPLQLREEDLVVAHGKPLLYEGQLLQGIAERSRNGVRQVMTPGQPPTPLQANPQWQGLAGLDGAPCPCTVQGRVLRQSGSASSRELTREGVVPFLLGGMPSSPLIRFYGAPEDLGAVSVNLKLFAEAVQSVDPCGRKTADFVQELAAAIKAGIKTGLHMFNGRVVEWPREKDPTFLGVVVYVARVALAEVEWLITSVSGPTEPRPRWVDDVRRRGGALTCGVISPLADNQPPVWFSPDVVTPAGPNEGPSVGRIVWFRYAAAIQGHRAGPSNCAAPLQSNRRKPNDGSTKQLLASQGSSSSQTQPKPGPSGQRAGQLPEWIWISAQGRCTQLFLTQENAGTLLRLRQTCATVTGRPWIYSHRGCRLTTRGRILEGIDGSPFMGRLGPQALWRTTEQRTLTTSLRIFTGDTIVATLPLVGGVSTADYMDTEDLSKSNPVSISLVGVRELLDYMSTPAEEPGAVLGAVNERREFFRASQLPDEELKDWLKVENKSVSTWLDHLPEVEGRLLKEVRSAMAACQPEPGSDAEKIPPRFAAGRDISRCGLTTGLAERYREYLTGLLRGPAQTVLGMNEEDGELALLLCSYGKPYLAAAVFGNAANRNWEEMPLGYQCAHPKVTSAEVLQSIAVPWYVDQNERISRFNSEYAEGDTLGGLQAVLAMFGRMSSFSGLHFACSPRKENPVYVQRGPSARVVQRDGRAGILVSVEPAELIGRTALDQAQGCRGRFLAVGPLDHVERCCEALGPERRGERTLASVGALQLAANKGDSVLSGAVKNFLSDVRDEAGVSLLSELTTEEATIRYRQERRVAEKARLVLKAARESLQHLADGNLQLSSAERDRDRRVEGSLRWAEASIDTHVARVERAYADELRLRGEDPRCTWAEAGPVLGEAVVAQMQQIARALLSMEVVRERTPALHQAWTDSGRPMITRRCGDEAAGALREILAALKTQLDKQRRILLLSYPDALQRWAQAFENFEVQGKATHQTLMGPGMTSVAPGQVMDLANQVDPQARTELWVYEEMEVLLRQVQRIKGVSIGAEALAVYTVLSRKRRRQLTAPPLLRGYSPMFAHDPPLVGYGTGGPVEVAGDAAPLAVMARDGVGRVLLVRSCTVKDVLADGAVADRVIRGTTQIPRTLWDGNYDARVAMRGRLRLGGTLDEDDSRPRPEEWQAGRAEGESATESADVLVAPRWRSTLNDLMEGTEEACASSEELRRLSLEIQMVMLQVQDSEVATGHPDSMGDVDPVEVFEGLEQTWRMRQTVRGLIRGSLSSAHRRGSGPTDTVLMDGGGLLGEACLAGVAEFVRKDLRAQHALAALLRGDRRRHADGTVVTEDRRRSDEVPSSELGTPRDHQPMELTGSGGQGLEVNDVTRQEWVGCEACGRLMRQLTRGGREAPWCQRCDEDPRMGRLREALRGSAQLRAPTPELQTGEMVMMEEGLTGKWTEALVVRRVSPMVYLVLPLGCLSGDPNQMEWQGCHTVHAGWLTRVRSPRTGGTLYDAPRPILQGPERTVTAFPCRVEMDEEETVVLSTSTESAQGLKELLDGKHPEGVQCLPEPGAIEEEEIYVGAVLGPDGVMEGPELVPPKHLWEQVPKIEGVHATFTAKVMGKETKVVADTAAQFCLVRRSALSNSAYANRRRIRARLLGIGGDLRIREMTLVWVRFGSDAFDTQGVWAWALIVPEEAIPFPAADFVCDFTTLTVVSRALATPEAGDYMLDRRSDVEVERVIRETNKEDLPGATSRRVQRPYGMGPSRPAQMGLAGPGSSL